MAIPHMRRDSKIGYGFWLVGVSLPYMLDNFFGPYVAFLAAIIGCALGIAFLASAHLSADKETVLSNREKRVIVGLAVASILGISLMGWRAWLHHQALPVGQTQIATNVAETPIEEPMLTAEVVIDSMTSRRIESHFVVENIGPVRVSNVRVYSHMEGVWDADVQASPSTDIIPRDKIEFLCPFVLSHKRPLDFQFVVIFNAEVRGRISTYHTTLSFQTMATAGPVQPLIPMAIHREIGDLPNALLVRPFYEQFDTPVGTIVMSFAEKNPDGSPGKLWIRNKRRQLLISGESEKIAFQAEFPVGKRMIERSFGIGTLGAHVVIAEWNDHEQTIGLSVDGSPLFTTKRP